MTIHAYTDPRGPNPAYINVSELVSNPGVAVITVRGPREQVGSTMILGPDQLQALADDINKFTGQPRVYTFDQFVQYGRDHGANIVNGMPWSFKFHGLPVTHETDERYLIMRGAASLHFTPDGYLVLDAGGRVGVCGSMLIPAE